MTEDPFDLRPLTGSPESLLHRLGALLPETLLPDVSTAHPLPLLLYDRGLTFWEARWESLPFLVVESGGFFFLPAPPPWTLPAGGAGEHPLAHPAFWSLVSRKLRVLNGGCPGHLDSLPSGCFAPMSSPPVHADTEILLCSREWTTLSGHNHKSHRWEKNRLLREEPRAGTFPWDLRYRKPVLKMLDRFFREKFSRPLEETERLLLEDQWRAHLKALSESASLGLVGLVAGTNDHPLGIGWFAVLREAKGAIQFLEAREPGLPGVSVLLTEGFFSLFPDIPLLNIQGDADSPGMRQAKRLEAPCRLSAVSRQLLDGSIH